MRSAAPSFGRRSESVSSGARSPLARSRAARRAGRSEAPRTAVMSPIREDCSRENPKRHAPFGHRGPQAQLAAFEKVGDGQRVVDVTVVGLGQVPFEGQDFLAHRGVEHLGVLPHQRVPASGPWVAEEHPGDVVGIDVDRPLFVLIQIRALVAAATTDDLAAIRAPVPFDAVGLDGAPHHRQELERQIRIARGFEVPGAGHTLGELLRRAHMQPRQPQPGQAAVGTVVIDHRDPLPDEHFELIEEDQASFSGATPREYTSAPL